MRHFVAYMLIVLLVFGLTVLIVRWRHDPHKAAYRKRLDKEKDDDLRGAGSAEGVPDPASDVDVTGT